MPMGLEPLMVVKLDAEEAEHDLRHVEEGNAAGGGDNADAKLLRHLDDAGAVDDQQRKERSESQSHGFHGDAGIAEFQQRRDAAEDEALEERVDGRGDRRPLLFEDGDHGADEAAEEAAEHPRGDVGEVARLKEGVPGEGSGGDGAEEQDAGLVDGAVERHAVGCIHDAAVACSGDVAEGVLAEGRIRCLEEWHGVFSVLPLRWSALFALNAGDRGFKPYFSPLRQGNHPGAGTAGRGGRGWSAGGDHGVRQAIENAGGAGVGW